MKNTFVHYGKGQLYEIGWQQEDYVVIKDIQTNQYLRISGNLLHFLKSCSDDEGGHLCAELFRRAPPSSFQRKSFLTRRVFEGKVPPQLVPKGLSFLFSSPRVMFTVIIISLMLTCALRWDEGAVLPKGVSFAWVILNIMCHEMGHVLACIQTGRKVGNIGFKLNYGLPMFFVDTKDVCMASSQGRMSTSLGGVYANALLLLSLLTIEIATQQSYAVLTGISLGFIVSNLIPFARLDGYYVLSDLLGSSDLGHDASNALRDWIKAPHILKRTALVLYGLLRLVFFGTVALIACLSLLRCT